MITDRTDSSILQRSRLSSVSRAISQDAQNGDFSPAQPWRAKTRLVPSKAADESKPEAYPQGYVEDFDESRTPLAGFFSILLQFRNWVDD
jgi:hypothetical protein